MKRDHSGLDGKISLHIPCVCLSISVWEKEDGEPKECAQTRPLVRKAFLWMRLLEGCVFLGTLVYLLEKTFSM